jgi:hypothetical protein
LRDFETLGLITRGHRHINLLDRSGLMREAALE